jgi:hypothetical protein
MEEILKVLDTNRRKWEYKYSGYIKQIVSYDKDDIYNEVFLKVYKQYQLGRIDMNTIEDYIFISYRNTIIALANKKGNKKNSHIEYVDDIREDFGEGSDYIEYFNDDNPIKKKIIEIIGDDNFNELIEYYTYKSAPTSQKHLFTNPTTEEPFCYKDQRKHQRLRRKLRFYLNNNKK